MTDPSVIIRADQTTHGLPSPAFQNAFDAALFVGWQFTLQFLKASPDYLPLMHLLLADGHRLPARAKQVYQDVVLKGDKLLAD